MLPPTTRGFDFTLLRRYDDLDSSSRELAEEEDATFRQEVNSQGFGRALCWTVCSATAIYTTKQLMTAYEYHYPLTIAFRVFASILVLYTIVVRLSFESWRIPGGKTYRWALRLPDDEGFLFSRHWLVMVPASLAAAASLPMLLEGLLHMPSLSVMIMLFPLAFAAESVVLFICCSPSRSRTYVPWEAILATTSSAIILYNEYRLTVLGLIWGVTGVLFIGLSRALFIIGSEMAASDPAAQSRLKAYHGFVIMTITFGMLFSAVALFQYERIQFSHSLSKGTFSLMVINITSFIGTAFSGSSAFVYSPIPFEDENPQFSNIPIRSLDFLSSISSSLLVVLVAMYTNHVSVSWIQIAAYFTAALCLAGPEQIHNYILICMDSTQVQINKSFRTEYSEPREQSRVLTGGTLFLAIIISSWALSTLSTAFINSLHPSLPSVVDTLYRPATRFEIVLSMYNESPTQVKSMLDTLKSTTLLSLIDPKITIYTKNPTHNLSSLKESTGATTVLRLPNLGREGGTYLSHIVKNWDSLAEQTLFIQAHAHNLREIIPRINSYLDPSTGFLSLGSSGITCTCGTCTDRWGWEDKWGVIPSLYQEIYSIPCTPTTPILLTYKGQFVISARRIRGIENNIYSNLLETITSKDGWGHNSTVIGEIEDGVTGKDSADNPYFGFTVERIWGLLGQCGTDEGVMVKCPSLLSGMGWGGRVEDCGCLDGVGTVVE